MNWTRIEENGENMLEEREKKILEFVDQKNYKPMKIREMAVLFRVLKSERGEFREAIDSLIRKKEIQIDRKGLICRPKSLTMEGLFMSTSRGFGFVRVDEEEDDIFIPERECGNAFHGDRVKIQVTGLGGKKRRKEGKIIRILERGTHRLVGTFSRNKNVCFVIPDNEKFNSDIYIAKGDCLGAVNGHKVVVELKNYGDDKHSPEGIVVQILGHANDPGVDILSIIKGFDIPEEFPQEVMDQLEEIPDKVKAADKRGREDFRKLLTVTIDGEDSKDLDDAITLRVKGNQDYELGVHIADVSHYVKENSPLDQEAIKRATSVYLVDRVIPMLPQKLSNGICSLNAGEDRLAMSCLMTFDASGRLKRHKICQSIIRVDERMTYTDVNDIISYRKEETCKRYEGLVSMFENMRDLATILNQVRTKQGSIDFEFPECKILLDKDGHPTKIVPYDRNIATRIIEEFMLAANKCVAEEYFWLDIPFLYRTHEKPDMEKIQELARITANFGYHMKLGTDEVHPREIQKLMGQIQGKPEEGFISRLTLRSMKRAEYSTVNDGHFGLASKYYCHFTSPIRRYPDLQIHRIMKEYMTGKLKGNRYDHYASLLPKIANETSDKERRADDAEREVEKLKKAEYMAEHVGECYHGVVSGVTSWGIYVELPNTVEGMVRLSDMEDDQYDYREEEYRVVGHHTGKEYRMGQAVYIRVEKVDKELRTIDFVMMEEE
ncbi:MAG: ribonuclease R [Eubacterium sp.]|nr:ribonuclease R [Eubacterium sp.]